MPPFAGPVLLKAGDLSGRFPLLDDLQRRMTLERRIRSVVVVVDSVQLSLQLRLLHRGEQSDVQEFISDPSVNDSMNGFSQGAPYGM